MRRIAIAENHFIAISFAIDKPIISVRANLTEAWLKRSSRAPRTFAAKIFRDPSLIENSSPRHSPIYHSKGYLHPQTAKVVAMVSSHFSCDFIDHVQDLKL